MYQAGWRNTGRRGLFILSPPAHINDLAPVVPRRRDVHINSSHTRERRGTRVEHRWVAGQEEKRRDRKMGRESANAFHPGCVIYNITDTATPKSDLRESLEKKATLLGQKQWKENVRIVNMFLCMTMSLSQSIKKTHVTCNNDSKPLVEVRCIISLTFVKISERNFNNECNFDSWL